VNLFGLARLSAAAAIVAALTACNMSSSGLATGGGKSARELAAEKSAIDTETTGKVEKATKPVEQPAVEVRETEKASEETTVAAKNVPAEPEPVKVEAKVEPEVEPKIEPKVEAKADPVPETAEAAKSKPVVAETKEKAAENSEAAKVETANVIRQRGSVAQRGTYIRALVNGEPITSYDVQRRVKFRQLRRERGGEQAALEELIDEHIKMQEATRLSAVATDAQVNEAFEGFARSNKATVGQISGELDRMGIGTAQFKDFIRAQISWRRTVGAKLRAVTIDKSQSEAIFELRKAGEDKPTLTEYRLQQIIFVIPADRRKELLTVRKNEAQNFRQKFSTCKESFELATSLRDVAVKNLGLMFEPEIPPEWQEEVKTLAIGETTKPKETDKGVEILAVCDAHQSADDRAAQISAQAQTIGDLETKGDEEADKILAELRKNATIIYR
jgi:peptidyl-prolyl cis-trans isomerase SurA